MSKSEVIVHPIADAIQSSEVPTLLRNIRPSWQSKDLITRVNRLINVDPSSACQRVFNAAIHDLREKLVVAGVDLAGDAAKRHKLPPVERNEDIENYPISKLIDLSYRIGLISRPDWRRLSRCYEIRRDLEHEDDEYEAGIEDCIYMFKTCVDVVLARDPIHLLRVADVKELIEKTEPAIVDQAFREDYQGLPQPRQEEIMDFLISTALEPTQPDIIRQNSFNCIQTFCPLTSNSAILELANRFQQRIGRNPIDSAHIRVAQASGILPYLKNAQRADYFSRYADRLDSTGYSFKSHSSHGEVLRHLREIGGLAYCPDSELDRILKWMVLTYIGEPGGYGAGLNRKVFYSNTAAPLIEEILRESADLAHSKVRRLKKDKDVRNAMSNEHVARRFEALLDIVETSVSSDDDTK